MKEKYESMEDAFDAGYDGGYDDGFERGYEDCRLEAIDIEDEKLTCENLIQDIYNILDNLDCIPKLTNSPSAKDLFNRIRDLKKE